MMIKLKNNAGFVKTAVLGFSWTTLFFGLLVPLIRGDLRWFFIMLIIPSIVISFLALLSEELAITICLIIMLLFAGNYNACYIKELMEKGFFPADEESKKILKKAKIFEE